MSSGVNPATTLLLNGIGLLFSPMVVSWCLMGPKVRDLYDLVSCAFDIRFQAQAPHVTYATADMVSQVWRTFTKICHALEPRLPADSSPARRVFRIVSSHIQCIGHAYVDLLLPSKTHTYCYRAAQPLPPSPSSLSQHARDAGTVTNSAFDLGTDSDDSDEEETPSFGCVVSIPQSRACTFWHCSPGLHVLMFVSGLHPFSSRGVHTTALKVSHPHSTHQNSQRWCRYVFNRPITPSRESVGIDYDALADTNTSITPVR